VFWRAIVFAWGEEFKKPYRLGNGTGTKAAANREAPKTTASRLVSTILVKSMDAVRAKLKQVILYIERNPKLVRSIASFPYIVNSL